MKLKPNEYQCVWCKEIFEKGWSDEEALEEKAMMPYADIPVEDCDLVCDDCFKKIMGGI